MEIDNGDGKAAWGRLLIVRVLLNVHKPLKRGTKVSTTRGGKVLAMFKYERLLDICFVCGRLDH